MEHVDSVATLRTLKCVSKEFAQPARNTLCDVQWLQRNNISLHGLLKQGSPTPALVTKLAKANPSCLHQRDGDGLLRCNSPRPTSRASAMHSDTIREVTVRACPARFGRQSDEARGLKNRLRPVRTRFSGVIVAA